MIKPSEVFGPSIASALGARGQYVYAYYEPGAYEPFYVGKGSGTRALDHWKNAIKNAKRPQELRIASILRKGETPHVRLLAYNLESSTEDRHALAERVLQDAFGIQAVMEKTPGGDRLRDQPVRLLQKREDSAKKRPLSLEAVLAMHSRSEPLSPQSFAACSEAHGCPILLVGLMKTFHPAYQDTHLKEMARMYWNLEKYKGTSLPQLLSRKAILVAWTSKLTGLPVAIGAWRIDGRKALVSDGRYAFPASGDAALKREFLGARLEGKGNHWQGPRLYAQQN